MKVNPIVSLLPLMYTNEPVYHGKKGGSKYPTDARSVKARRKRKKASNHRKKFNKK